MLLEVSFPGRVALPAAPQRNLKASSAVEIQQALLYDLFTLRKAFHGREAKELQRFSLEELVAAGAGQEVSSCNDQASRHLAAAGTC